MSGALDIVRTSGAMPALIAASGARASYRFLEFFTANIRNPHTRRAYARAATEFFDWLAAKGVTQLADIAERSRRHLHRGIAARAIRADREASPGRVEASV